ncbi:MAG: fatty acid desaturase CarF family protein [Pseudonocardia sp.]
MAPRDDEVGPVLPKSTTADVVTPQAVLFDAGAFRPAEIMVHAVGACLNVLACCAGLVLAGTASGSTDVALVVPVVVAGAAVGWFSADLMSGVLHWALDTWFCENVPAVRRIVLIVREHHVYPQQIFKYRWTHEFGIMSWFGFMVVAMALALVTVLPIGPLADLALLSAAVVTSLGASFSLELHKLGHDFAPRRAVRLLQRLGLVLGPAHHMKHHSGEHDSHYCIVNGWGDCTLGRLGLFRVLEQLIAHSAKTTPRADDRAWRRAFGRSVRG